LFSNFAAALIDSRSQVFVSSPLSSITQPGFQSNLNSTGGDSSSFRFFSSFPSFSLPLSSLVSLCCLFPLPSSKFLFSLIFFLWSSIQSRSFIILIFCPFISRPFFSSPFSWIRSITALSISSFFSNSTTQEAAGIIFLRFLCPLLLSVSFSLDVLSGIHLRRINVTLPYFSKSGFISKTPTAYFSFSTGRFERCKLRGMLSWSWDFFTGSLQEIFPSSLTMSKSGRVFAASITFSFSDVCFWIDLKLRSLSTRMLPPKSSSRPSSFCRNRSERMLGVLKKNFRRSAISEIVSFSCFSVMMS